MTEVPIIEIRSLQCTGFYMIVTFIMKEFKSLLLLPIIEELSKSNKWLVIIPLTLFSVRVAFLKSLHDLTLKQNFKINGRT